MSTGSQSFGQGADALADAFYPLYRRAFSERSDFVADVETKLAEARMDDPVELFVSRALGVGVLLGVVLWALGLGLGYVLFYLGLVGTESLIGVPVPNETLLAVIRALKIPALVVGTGLVFGFVGFVLGFGGLIAVPYMRSSTREREINMLLADSVSFMYALSIGGMNQLEILEAMAKADDTYGEVAMEFRAIVQETEYFDTDYRTAVRNRAMETPSDELSQFLTDMLSIINSGGNMTEFLADKKDKHMRTAKQQQELTLETLELFGEMYMTLSLFPLLLIIILVIMSMLGQAQMFLLYATVYVLTPMVGLGFLVLVATVKEDELGDGYLELGDGETSREPGLRDLGLVERFVGEYGIFDRVRSREGTHETLRLLKHPGGFFRDRPLFTLAFTVPVVAVVMGAAVFGGVAPTTWDGIVDQPIWGTFLYAYVPLYGIGVPLAVFREWNVRSRHRITNKLSDNLRKLSSANDTGMTLLESVQTVADTTTGKLGQEFEVMYAKVNYGTSLRQALVEFNNKYHIPRLARTVKLVAKAQEASSQITAVLTTAAQASENQDDIDRERRSRARMQVVIIIMTYLTLLAVMVILDVKFLGTMEGLSTSTGAGSEAAQAGSNQMDFGGGIDTDVLGAMFFHAVTIQGLVSGFIAGYIRDASVLAGVKFAVILPTVALIAFSFT